MKRTAAVSVLTFLMLIVFSAVSMCDSRDKDQNYKVRELEKKVASLEQTVATQQVQIAELQDAVDSLGKMLKKAEWKMNFKRDHKEKEVPTAVPTAVPTPVPTAVPAAMAVKTGRVDIGASKIEILGQRDGKTEFAYTVALTNKEGWEVTGFRLKISLKDSNGFTIDTYTTEQMRIGGSWAKKTVDGEGIMRSDRSSKVTGATAEIVWP